jgi:hypothetical protein
MSLDYHPILLSHQLFRETVPLNKIFSSLQCVLLVSNYTYVTLFHLQFVDFWQFLNLKSERGFRGLMETGETVSAVSLRLQHRSGFIETAEDSSAIS